MKINELQDLVQNSLEDMKAVDIVSIDVKGKSSMTDILYIATGNSTRHVKSIAEMVGINVKEAGVDIIGTEGKGTSEWVLVDLNDIIVHVMLESTREFYALEKLWEPADATDKTVEEAISDKG
jgi:ribosome-associated protein